ncbi:CHASE3 domain-containing protein [Azospirillum canadense]|uniref:CHASE3 domain-containing protein n=1 Tax=Azospirillum canadense TaxID=403962 RepID=UPI002227730A|nr:CHASE3 domain-containing protein [Azospirillum canadense]MCW2240469.1 CHASE3 domain sensor protein [Azospirillum canadense]
MRLRIAQKSTIAFAAIILMAAGVSVISFRTLSFLQTSNGWTAHSYEVLEDASHQMAAMADQQTGLRDLLLTADAALLEPYMGGLAAFESAFATLKRLTGDNPGQQARQRGGRMRNWRRFANWRTNRPLMMPATAAAVP